MQQREDNEAESAKKESVEKKNSKISRSVMMGIKVIFK